jgi:hypothetical protein
MDVIASWALECPDIKAIVARGDPRQHGSCLTCGAKWLEDDHDARLGLGGSVTELSVTGRRRYRAVMKTPWSGMSLHDCAILLSK